MRPFHRPRPGRVPLRWKIAALAAATACLVAAAVGVLVHLWTAGDVRDRAEMRAFNSVYSAVDTYRRTGTLADGAELDPAELPAALRHPDDGERHTAYDGRIDDNVGPTAWAAQRVGGPGSPVLAVRVNMSPELHDLRRLDVSMAVASLVALAAAVPLAVYGAGLLGRRLRRVSETAGRISAGDLDARTGPTKGGDEVADIAATVDLMADSLGRRLRTERQFTADVAHELRTPVGGLLAATDLLPPGESEDLVRARVRDLRGLVEDLLEISRLDAGAEHPVRAHVPLGAVVREAVARTGFDAEVTDARDAWAAETAGAAEAAETVETDPRRLERIVGNLVVNAHRHGAAPVEVTVDGRTVVVRDHGPGFPPDVLREGPRRFHTGAAERGSGHGLGLTIALGQARVLGAELRLDNHPDGGAVATLRLPPS
ncbi:MULTISPECIES: HAMP domain-containing sensor histidine kinase [unclassified Streptomyces]|uniref:sensor histidine kinase n=1 Tax=unclassified Streptomyces TaxID=2593676 RepID=UPI00224DEC3C|nr:MULTISPECIES: HAMP domain-containing sensor histidine kinase [unclassified Streptomyces]MCX4524097.1 HAMP domain-containing histidine kinase [Streptomyces sp. NBC_01551]MCX4545385.1 HAMP domain-containing histidine kinase [Streptomyces sp. NBC_01565]